MGEPLDRALAIVAQTVACTEMAKKYVDASLQASKAVGLDASTAVGISFACVLSHVFNGMAEAKKAGLLPEAAWADWLDRSLSSLSTGLTEVLGKRVTVRIREEP